jgi:hypothetical protein
MDAEAMKLALRNMRRNAGRKRLGLEDGDPKPDPEARFTINIGVEPGSEGYTGDADPNAEVFGDADDDDPELPGRVRKTKQRR